MFQYRLFILGMMGVLLVGLQYINAAETESTITSTSSKTTADGNTVTETKGTLERTPSGKFPQIRDGLQTRFDTGYETLNRISGGRLDNAKNLAVGLMERVKSRKGSQPTDNAVNNVDSKSTGCILPSETTGKSETVVQTTKTTQP